MWQQIIDILKYVYENAGAFVVALNGLLLAFIGLFALIPGEQPEKFLKSIVDFIAKFSRK